jgi:hypothetical protein
MFNEICRSHPAKIAAVLRERDGKWASGGASAFEHLQSGNFSEKVIETIKSAKESIVKKAGKIVAFFLRNKPEKKKEEEKEKKPKEEQKSESIPNNNNEGNWGYSLHQNHFVEIQHQNHVDHFSKNRRCSELEKLRPLKIF